MWVSLVYSDFGQLALSGQSTLQCILLRKHLLTHEVAITFCLFLQYLLWYIWNWQFLKQSESTFVLKDISLTCYWMSRMTFGQLRVKIRCVTCPAHQTMWLVEESAITFLSNQTYHFNRQTMQCKKKNAFKEWSEKNLEEYQRLGDGLVLTWAGK